VNTHVTVSLVARLPVPVVQEAHPFFARLEASVVALTEGNGAVEEMEEYAQAQAIAAHLYKLTAAQFEHVLTTFPLVPSGIRQRALLQFSNLR
jgi:hypothetical protein